MQRRRHLRVGTDATVKLMDGNVDRIIEGKVLDISESGMKVSFEGFIPEKSVTPFQFALKLDDTVLVVLAQMHWVGRVNPVEMQCGLRVCLSGRLATEPPSSTHNGPGRHPRLTRRLEHRTLCATAKLAAAQGRNPLRAAVFRP